MSSSNKVKILIVVLITLTIVITISYAFFASSINTTNNVSFNTTLEDGATMIRSYNAENENLNITMNLTGFDTFYRDETAVAKKVLIMYLNGLIVHILNQVGQQMNLQLKDLLVKLKYQIIQLKR